VRDGGVERGAADAQRLRGDRDAPAIQRAQRDAESLTARAEDRLRADPHLLELEIHAAEPAHAERVRADRASETRRVHRHEKGGDAAAARVRLGRREHDGDLRRLGVGYPHFAAGDGVAAIVRARDGLLVAGVGAGVLLGQREGANRVAGCQAPQPFLFLRGGAELGNRLGDERGVDRGDDRDDRAGPGEGLDRQRVSDVVPSAAAPLARDRRAKQAERRRLADQRTRELAGLIDPRRLRRDAVCGKPRDLLLECELVGVKVEGHWRWARRSKTGRSRSAVAGSSSGSTRVWPTIVMKLVSPFQRGTTWTCR
jgi:hypothetical protein